MSPYERLRNLAGVDGKHLARWIAVTRWLVSEGAPLEATAAASEMVAAGRRMMRSRPHRLHRNNHTGRVRAVAFAMLKVWRDRGEPGMTRAANAACKMITTQRRLARTQG